MAKVQLVGAGSQLWIHNRMLTCDEFGNICQGKKGDSPYSGPYSDGCDCGGRGCSGCKGSKGDKGNKGNKGERGLFGTGIMYLFENDTSESNLLAGRMRFNNTDVEAADQLYLNVLTLDSFMINAHVLDWISYGSSGDHGHLYFVNTVEGSSFAHYRVTSVTYATDHFNIGVQHISSDPVPFVAPDEKVNITFVPKGSPGSGSGLPNSSVDYNIRLDKATDQVITWGITSSTKHNSNSFIWSMDSFFS